MRQPNGAACWIIDHAGHVLPLAGYRGDAETIRYHTYEGAKRWHAGPPGGVGTSLRTGTKQAGKMGHKSPVAHSRDRLMDFTMLPPSIA